MHVPDGFLDVTTSIGAGVVSASLIAVAVKRSAHELHQVGAPLAGLTAVFVFAAQMINFPVGAGTSGHLLGGTLAAVLVGPWTGVLAMTVVLGVQALFFADGGITALGTNVLLMGIIPVLVGYGLARALVRIAPPRRGFVAAAAGIGALVSVPAAALTFTLLYAVGGAVQIPLGALVAAMLGWHVIIGVGEALITTAVVSAVLATRPDLVFLARSKPAVTLRDAQGRVQTGATAGQLERAPAPSGRWWTAAIAVTVIVAGGLSLFASAHPDGLEYVGQRLGFGAAAADSPTAGSPLADYGISGIDAAWASGLAGVIGLALVACLGYAVMALIARGRQAPQRELSASPR